MKKQNIMKQPELGSRIQEIRNQKGITQKELADSCNIDIRTIQRIEAGDVTPRISTLKFIASALSCELSVFNGDHPENGNAVSPNFLITWLVTGVVYFISWFLFSPIIPANQFLQSISLLSGFIYTLAGVLFYFGFWHLGNSHRNTLLKTASIIVMVCIPLLFIIMLISAEFSFMVHVNKLVVFLMSVNSVVFGLGLLRMNNQLTILYKITGILQILIAPFFLIPLSVTYLIGFWLSVPYLLLLLAIVYLEFKASKNQQLQAEMV